MNVAQFTMLKTIYVAPGSKIKWKECHFTKQTDVPSPFDWVWIVGRNRENLEKNDGYKPYNSFFND